jgi:hypothetical protein
MIKVRYKEIKIKKKIIIKFTGVKETSSGEQIASKRLTRAGATDISNRKKVKMSSL